MSGLSDLETKYLADLHNWSAELTAWLLLHFSANVTPIPLPPVLPSPSEPPSTSSGQAPQ